MTGETLVLNVREFFQTREITERTEYTLDADLKWFRLVLLKSKALTKPDPPILNSLISSTEKTQRTLTL